MSADHVAWDMEYDVVILGSGGAALTAAIAAHDFGAKDVVILEKGGMVGGTTAMSGGVLWIPLNHHEEECGVTDSWDDVVTYLNTLAPELLDPDTLAAFLETGPQMVRHLEEKTPVRFDLFEGFPDYQPDTPGAKRNGSRSLDPGVYPFEELGSWASRVNPPKYGVPSKMTLRELHVGGKLSPEEFERRRNSDCRGSGQALVGALLKGVLDRGIKIQFETRGRELCQDGSRITGVVAEAPTGDIAVRARKGVVIATGGFEWNKDLVNAFLRGPLTGPVSVPENEGDGLLMAMKVGARLGNMSNAWWMMSTLYMKAQHREARPNYLICQNERTLPRSIMVNRSGRRFVNEATNYCALGRVLHNYDARTFDYPHLPYWLIFDSVHLASYPVFVTKPGDEAPAWFSRANTIEGLAGQIGIDGPTLRDTVDRFNADVRKGHDDEFCRGDNTYDNYWGDKSFHAPHCTLGVLDRPPFYAVAMEAGSLGTSGGPKTNEHAQALDWDDNVIAGLYVAGNAMAAVTATAYGGAGGTLGPGMTFGFIAGRHAATASD